MIEAIYFFIFATHNFRELRSGFTATDALLDKFRGLWLIFDELSGVYVAEGRWLSTTGSETNSGEPSCYVMAYVHLCSENKKELRDLSKKYRI